MKLFIGTTVSMYLLLTAGETAFGQNANPPLNVTEAHKLADGRSILYVTTEPDKVFAVDAETGAVELLRPESAGLTVAAAPTFSPGSGTYSGPQLVTLKTLTPRGVICFTTNGIPPTPCSNIYQGPISITSNTTIKAITVAPPGGANSPIVTASYSMPSLTFTGGNLGTYSRSGWPPHSLSDIPLVPLAVDTHSYAPGWFFTPVYRLMSEAGPNGEGRIFCNLFQSDGTKMNLQCNPSIPLGTSVITIQASDELSPSVLGIFTLTVTP